jgi:ribosomal-protein-serine acetyltransferase
MSLPRPAPGRHHRLMERPREILTHGPVTLRRWQAADADQLYLAVTESTDHLQPWMPWAADYKPASAAEFLRQSEQDWESGDAFNYALTVPGSGLPGSDMAGSDMAGSDMAGSDMAGSDMAGSDMAGSCGLMARIGPGGLEIGYWVHAGHTRRGLATAAAAALTAEAFTLPGIDRVEIVHDEENLASGQIPRKLGFTEIGRRPHPPGRPAAYANGTDVVWRITR